MNDKQTGFMLIEALIGMLLFSIGIVGVIALQASAISISSDATYRGEASYLADQIIGQMWADRLNVANYQLNVQGAACAPGGNSSTNQNVSAWLQGMSLPGSSTLMQQILVNPTSNAVTVTLCWQPSKAKAPHKIVVTTSIN